MEIYLGFFGDLIIIGILFIFINFAYKYWYFSSFFVTNLSQKTSYKYRKSTLSRSIKMELKKKAMLAGWKVYEDSVGKITIEIPIKDREVLLKRQELNKWLLISDKIPQVVLKTKQASIFIQKTIKEQRNSLMGKGFPIPLHK